MSTGYVWHERYAWHDTGTPAGFFPTTAALQPHRHFENAETKTRLASLVEVSGMLDHLVRLPAMVVTRADLCRVHTDAYVDRIEAASASGGGDAGDPQSPFGPGAYDIARLSAGGVIAATDAVLSGRVSNAYALVRPPGHHALPHTGMGFCLFGNIAIAIEWARAVHGVDRVAVVDYDVHHGNGTQAVYYADPDVLTISIHQDELFPSGSGRLEERGQDAAHGTAVNVPLPAGSGNGAYVESMRRVVAPAVRAFAPELIMVASGFDASVNDPLGRMMVTASGFRTIARELVQLADQVCGGRLVMAHEGGYSPVYVPFCGLAVLESLAGTTTGVDDPFFDVWDHKPQHRLTGWQDEVITAAAEMLGT